MSLVNVIGIEIVLAPGKKLFFSAYGYFQCVYGNIWATSVDYSPEL